MRGNRQSDHGQSGHSDLHSSCRYFTDEKMLYEVLVIRFDRPSTGRLERRVQCRLDGKCNGYRGKGYDRTVPEPSHSCNDSGYLN